MTQYDQDGVKEVSELFEECNLLYHESYPESRLDFARLNLTGRLTYGSWAHARGHFADVYKGEMDDGAAVAVKTLRLPSYRSSSHDIYRKTFLRFFREFNHWGQLEHINVAPLLGFTMAGGNISLVSPWYPQGNLVQYLRAKPAASKQDLVLDVAEGTMYLHTCSSPLIHGDLKGANILVCENGIARLADFGISKQIDDMNRKTGFTTTSDLKGTTPWMAPELCKEAPLSFPSDVYSCAGVFLEVYSGKIPYYYIAQPLDLILTKSRGEMPQRHHYAEVAEDDTLWEIMTRCWEYEPQMRPGIQEVVQDLYENFQLLPRIFPNVAREPLPKNGDEIRIIMDTKNKPQEGKNREITPPPVPSRPLAVYGFARPGEGSANLDPDSDSGSDSNSNSSDVANVGVGNPILSLCPPPQPPAPLNEFIFFPRTPSAERSRPPPTRTRFNELASLTKASTSSRHQAATSPHFLSCPDQNYAPSPMDDDSDDAADSPAVHPYLPFFSHKLSTETASSSLSPLLNTYPYMTELASLANASSTSVATFASQQSIPYSAPVTPTQAATVGWGKVVVEGGILSVHTLGVVNGKDVSAGMVRSDTSSRLEDLRKLMRAEPEPLDYYIVPSEDSHQSEFVAAPDKRREFISGFTGTSGIAVISLAEAHLFVDSRYYLQADRQLDSNWKIKKVGLPGVKDWIQWLRERPLHSVVGIDDRFLPHGSAIALISALAQSQSRLKFPRRNLIDVIWKQRPPKRLGPIYIHEERFAGRSAREKIESIQTWIKAQKPVNSYSAANSKAAGTKPSSLANVPTATIITNLSSVAWLLNLRGSDLPYTPVFHSYLFVSLVAAVLFVDRKKITAEADSYLKENNVTIRDYNEIFAFLRIAGWGAGRVLIDPKTPYIISLMLSPSRYILANSQEGRPEIPSLRSSFLRDGAATVRFLAWLDEKMTKNEPVSEWGASQKLTEYKRINQEFVGLAYENISATGSNASHPEYTPTRTSALLLDHRTPYLIDSGGQYFDGTCETTRTLHFGIPTREQCEAYTNVLRLHIALDSFTFPEGTTGALLNTYTRLLRARRMACVNAESHGDKSSINMHGFSDGVPLEPGRVLTNGPAFYKGGEWGVRIESVLLVRERETKLAGDNRFEFERSTQVPIQTRMILPEMLTEEERRWVKMHNVQVRQALAPLLADDKRALLYLERECMGEGLPVTHREVKAGWDLFWRFASLSPS